MKKFFRKPDEMERHILFRSQRNAYFFFVIALLVWTFYESAKVFTQHTRLNLLPCLLLVGGLWVQNLSQLILTRHAVKDDEDSFETAPLFKLIVFICVVVGVVATVAASVILMGVRT